MHESNRDSLDILVYNRRIQLGRETSLVTSCFPAAESSSGRLVENRVVVVGVRLVEAASGVVIEAYPPLDFRKS